MHRVFSVHVSNWVLLLLAGDAVAYCLGVIAGTFFNPKVSPDPWMFLVQRKAFFLLIGLVYLVVFYVADLYDYQEDYRRWTNVARVLISAWVGTLLVIIIFYFPLGAFIGRVLLVIQAAVFSLLLALWRWTFSAVALPQRLKRKLLIAGGGNAGKAVLAAIRRRPGCGLEPIGFVDDDPAKQGTQIEGLPVLGDSTQLEDLVHRHHVNLVVAVTQETSSPLISTLTRISWGECQVLDMPSFYEFLAGKVPVEYVSDVWLYLNSLQCNKIYYRHIKRVLDLVLGVAGLVLTLPLFLLIPVAIKLDSPGPVFFRQERLGLGGKPFQILKFRTMVTHAEENGPCYATVDDPRTTRVGRILRRLRLDELPQLFNILRGEMSFIGPRPERDIFVREFKEPLPVLRPGRRKSDPPGTQVVCGFKETIPYYSFRLLVKPGLTGWAQVMHSYASSLEQTQEKLKYDLYYIKNIGFFLDLAILLKTIRIVLFGRGS